MGTYTKFHCRIKLSYDAPERVIEFLREIIGYCSKDLIDCPAPVPPDENDFFLCYRWQNLFFSSDAGKPSFKLLGRTWVLELRAEILNHDSDIQHFVEWISPYVKKSRRKKPVYLGWSKTECSDYQYHYYAGESYVYRP